ncbi:alpha/beta fold hydrolase [Nocardioides mesophilus]|uniref:Alpha/beta fold hydrolase n=1 Tax=Nocardioides mesophilus TaxID=433659 RepID=A0A7G9R7R0_9ACTN|nr:alpha/beta fold hydrolase [Nocardioides mesophilus]QNN51635.1 alpha/beta fold hydrolase [Nocardioides mesophilus]
MDIILIPGLWLDGSCWAGVVPALEQTGHRAHPLTLPGMESRDAPRSGITFRYHVDAVVPAIDAADGPVLLVAHSAGCGIGHAAVDARPDRIARAVYVGGFPTPDGSPLLDGLPAANGEVLMPDWAELGEEASIADLDEPALARLYAEAIPVPEGVVTEPQQLRDPRRYQVPVTAVCPEYTSEQLQGWVNDGVDDVKELTMIRDVEYVDLPGGHWPQLVQPGLLARVILDAAR